MIRLTCRINLSYYLSTMKFSGRSTVGFWTRWVCLPDSARRSAQAIFVATIFIHLVGLISPLHGSDDEDLLAKLPQLTGSDRQVVSLLKIGRPKIDSRGTITIPIYNPTRFFISQCTIQVTLPSEKTPRAYTSSETSIPPLTDGAFQFTTAIFDQIKYNLDYQIIGIAYGEKSAVKVPPAVPPLAPEPLPTQ